MPPEKFRGVIGIIKEVLGFRQFSLRGLSAAAGEWNLVCLAFNLKRLHTLLGAWPPARTSPARQRGADARLVTLSGPYSLILDENMMITHSIDTI